MNNKNAFLVTIPNVTIVEKIFELRRKIVKLGYGQLDPRANVLPHVTITYIENKNLSKDQINLIVKKLLELNFSKSITLTIKELLNWKHKIVASFDTNPIKELVTISQNLLRGLGLKVNDDYIKLYGNTIGDHMKIARHIDFQKLPLAMKLINSELPKKIVLDRIAFVGYDCDEKDIFWEKILRL